MKPINPRRILSIIPRPVLQEASNTPGPRAYPIQLDSTATALAALVLLIALFFLCFFSACSRRLFSLVHRREARLYAPSLMAHPRRSMPFPPPYGLDPGTLQSLPVIKGRKEFGCCVVCLSDFEEKDYVKVIPRCGHGFHPGCIDVWLLMQGSCPVCRCSDMVTGSRSYSGLESVLVNDTDSRGGRGSESNREEEIEDDGRDKKMVRLGRSNSWVLGREMGRNGSVSSMRRTGSF